MITERVQISYQLKFTSAFHFGTGLRARLIDRAVARDGQGYLYVPGSTLKGALRERCEQLAQLFELRVLHLHEEDWSEVRSDIDIISRIFGSRFYPGHLYFDDAQLVEEQRAWFESPASDRQVREQMRTEFRTWQVEQRTQVSLSRLTNTAKQGMLYTSEYGICSLLFRGQIAGVLTDIALEDDTSATYALLLLLASLRSLDRIGGNKSVGAGQVECTITRLLVNDQDIAPDKLLNTLDSLEYYQIALEMEVEG